MRTKKVLQMTALAALATAAWVGAGSVDASAAVSKVEFNSSGSGDNAVTLPELKVTTSNVKEVMFGVATYNKGKGTLKVNDSAWDVYEVASNNTTTIDLSKISNTKDTYIAIRTESDAPTYYKIAAAVSKQKITYDVSKETAKVEIQKPDTVKSATFEYRTPYGTWQKLEDTTTFGAYKGQGASLYVRAKIAVDGTTKEKLKDISLDTNGTDCEVTVLGSLPGKESKLNIAKQANGPKVTLDYVKGTIKLPKGTKYRTLQATNDTAYETPSTEADSKTEAQAVSALISEGKKGAMLQVCKPATDKKPASKWTIVDLKVPTPIVSPAPDAAATFNPDGGEITGIAKITYETDKAGKYSTKKSIMIENKVEGTINVIVGDKDKVPGATDQSKAIKKGGKASIKVEDGKVVYVRKAGDKSKSEWASAYTGIGTVKIPADPSTPAPSTNP